MTAAVSLDGRPGSRRPAGAEADPVARAAGPQRAARSKVLEDAMAVAPAIAMTVPAAAGSTRAVSFSGSPTIRDPTRSAVRGR